MYPDVCRHKAGTKKCRGLVRVAANKWHLGEQGIRSPDFTSGAGVGMAFLKREGRSSFLVSAALLWLGGFLVNYLPSSRMGSCLTVMVEVKVCPPTVILTA